MPDAHIDTATRQIFWNLESPAHPVVMYAIFAASVVVLAWGCYARYRLWTAGKPDNSRLGSYGRRFVQLWDGVLLQKLTNREATPQAFHSLIFWGFLALLFATTMVLLHHDFGLDVYSGKYYLAVTLIADLFGLGLMVGLGIALHRRAIARPDRLHSTWADYFMILLLLLLCVQGFVLEGLRIAATDDPWALYSPIGLLVSKLAWGWSETAIRIVHVITWWFHAISVFLFFALIPYSKFFHIVASSLNLFFVELRRPKGRLAYPGDIESLLEASMEDGAEDFSIGTSTLNDYSWKRRLDLDACTSCGRCQSVCPAYNSGKVLSPKWMILDTRNHMLKLHAKAEGGNPLDHLDRSLVDAFFLRSQAADPDGNGTPRRAHNQLVEEQAVKALGEDADARIAGDVLDEDVFWSCTTCRACEEVCPVGIQHVDHIVDVRRSMALMEGNLPSEAQGPLRAIETRGNPYGPAEDRAAWMDGLDVPVLEPGAEVDVLYWVGCVSAYDKRKQAIARSMVQILNASGLNWGLLGNKESCTGDPARRLGEENLFQSQAKCNIELLRSVSFERIVANCPHCFNTLKNEYPDIGDIADGRQIEVIHHSQFIHQLLDSDELTLRDGATRDFTFHDPCYLGRYNDTYDEPREVLVQLGNSRVSEMSEHRERGKCCGAGGGHFWFDMKVGERVNSQRIDQAAATGASTIATACPFCMQMLEDGVKLTEREEQLEVRDIAELVAEALPSD